MREPQTFMKEKYNVVDGNHNGNVFKTYDRKHKKYIFEKLLK